MKNERDHRDTYRARFILAAVFFALFILDLVLVLSGKTEAFDAAAGSAVMSLRNAVRTPIYLTVTQMGSWKVIVSIGALILLANFFRWKKKDVPIAVAACFLDLGLYSAIKPVVQRIRPPREFWLLIEHGFSFPSGHTMNSMFCYGMMIYLIIRNSHSRPLTIVMTGVLSLLIVFIGFSRIFCGVHYVTDMLGGACLGFSMLMLATVAIDEIMLRRFPEGDAPRLS